jgi:hypothetical protein
MRVFEGGSNADQKHATNEGGANAVSSITIAANADEFWVLDHLTFSASADPAANTTLTIAIGSTTVWKHFITAGGVGPIPLGGLATGVKNEAVTITASAAGGTTKVNLSVIYR